MKKHASLWYDTTIQLPQILMGDTRYPCNFCVKDEHVYAGAYCVIPKWFGGFKKFFRAEDGRRFAVTEVTFWRELPHGPFARREKRKFKAHIMPPLMVPDPKKTRIAATGDKCKHEHFTPHQETVGRLTTHTHVCDNCTKVIKRWRTTAAGGYQPNSSGSNLPPPSEK